MEVSRLALVFLLGLLLRFGTTVETTDQPEKEDHKCGKNEEYSGCLPSCPLKCGEKPRENCPTFCTAGCGCKKGFWRDHNDKCVLPEDCTKGPQGPTTTFVPATAPHGLADATFIIDVPTAPPPKKKPTAPPTQAPEPTTQPPEPTLPPKPPQPQCGENEEWNECNSACPKKCGPPGPPIPCTKECITGCGCKTGYVLDPTTKKCVLPKDCSAESQQSVIIKPAIDPTKTCDQPNQVYRTCGSECPATCKTPRPFFCTFVCVPGCFCKAGFLLNDEKQCVLPSECPGYVEPAVPVQTVAPSPVGPQPPAPPAPPAPRPPRPPPAPLPPTTVAPEPAALQPRTEQETTPAPAPAEVPVTTVPPTPAPTPKPLDIVQLVQILAALQQRPDLVQLLQSQVAQPAPPKPGVQAAPVA